MHGTISIATLAWKPREDALTPMQRLVLQAAASVRFIDPDDVKSNISNGVYRSLRIRGLLRALTTPQGRCGYAITEEGREAL